MASSNEGVFVYTGQGRDSIPEDVTRVRVDASVEEIPNNAFRHCRRLEAVELPEFGLRQIGELAFGGCSKFKSFTIPRTLNIIGDGALTGLKMEVIDLPEGLQYMGSKAFLYCGALKLRVPPYISFIQPRTFQGCGSLFSIELGCGIDQICGDAFAGCPALRNVALPNRRGSWASCMFKDCHDLQLALGTKSGAKMIQILKRRFQGFPVHSLCYYHSYRLEEEVLSCLRSWPVDEFRKVDCLGMTPLHILACSAKQELALYRVIVKKYPASLIAKDKWGDVPLFYAVWGRAPNEIIDFLVEQLRKRHPKHKLDWEKMVETLSKSNPSPDIIRHLHEVQQRCFPEDSIEWTKVRDKVLKECAELWTRKYVSKEVFQFLVLQSVSSRCNAIVVKEWREDIAKKVWDENLKHDSWLRREYLHNVLSSITTFSVAQAGAQVLELALWKAKMMAESACNQEGERRNKKAKVDNVAFRQRCRISCGADAVIENMLPYLVGKKKPQKPLK